MKKLLFAIIISGGISCDSNNDYVYICNSETSKVYHKIDDCTGLDRCTHGIIRVTKSEAINKYHRRACHVCY